MVDVCVVDFIGGSLSLKFGLTTEVALTALGFVVTTVTDCSISRPDLETSDADFDLWRARGAFGVV